MSKDIWLDIQPPPIFVGDRGDRGLGDPRMSERTVLSMSALRSAGFAAVLALSRPRWPSPRHADDRKRHGQGLYDTLLNTMKNGHILGQSGRFVQLEPVIRRSFDIAGDGPVVGRLVLGRAERGATPAGDGELSGATSRRSTPSASTAMRGQKLQVTDEQPGGCRRHGAQPDHQSQWRAGQGRLSDAPQRRERG